MFSGESGRLTNAPTVETIRVAIRECKHLREKGIMDGRNAENEVLNGQRHHWEKIFTKNSEMFGTEPSYPARKAAELFKKEDKGRILELGGGQGRDTLFFARNDF